LVRWVCRSLRRRVGQAGGTHAHSRGGRYSEGNRDGDRRRARGADCYRAIVGASGEGTCGHASGHRTIAGAGGGRERQPAGIVTRAPGQSPATRVTDIDGLIRGVARPLLGGKGKTRGAHADSWRDRRGCDGEGNRDGLRAIGRPRGAERHCAAIVADGQRPRGCRQRGGAVAASRSWRERQPGGILACVPC